MMSSSPYSTVPSLTPYDLPFSSSIHFVTDRQTYDTSYQELDLTPTVGQKLVIAGLCRALWHFLYSLAHQFIRSVVSSENRLVTEFVCFGC